MKEYGAIAEHLPQEGNTGHRKLKREGMFAGKKRRSSWKKTYTEKSARRPDRFASKKIDSIAKEERL